MAYDMLLSPAIVRSECLHSGFGINEQNTAPGRLYIFIPPQMPQSEFLPDRFKTSLWLPGSLQPQISFAHTRDLYFKDAGKDI
jgi:hypothetical protein